MDERARRLHAGEGRGAGTLLSAINPKNLIFGIGGATAVAQLDLSGGEQVGAWAVFTVVATVVVAVPMLSRSFAPPGELQHNALGRRSAVARRVKERISWERASGTS